TSATQLYTLSLHDALPILRNKLTLFDECGVVVCLQPDTLAHGNLLRAHQWQHSFVGKRQDWWQSIRPMVFGHAMYEMATAPFIRSEEHTSELQSRENLVCR